MNADKIREVVTIYKTHLERLGYLPLKVSDHMVLRQESLVVTEEALQHALWMLDAIEPFLLMGQIERANRWLGFVQGVFWLTGSYTIREMADHNRETAVPP